MSRFGGLDRVRAGAMMLGVAYHAAYAFIPDVGPWYPVQARSTWSGFAVVAGVLHAVRMPVFFALSGFFAALVLERRGEGFLRDRFSRLGVPLFVAAPLSLLADRAIRALAVSEGVMDARYEAQAGWALRPLHLWFLEYLLLFCVVAWALAKLRVPWRLDAVLRRMPDALLGLSLLTFGAQALWGEPQPAFSFLPQAATVAAYGPFFAVGWALFAVRDDAGALERHAALRVVLAAAVLLGVFTSPLQWQPLGHGLAALAAWLVTLGLLGAALGARGGEPGPLVQSAYWVYLVHHPLVQLGQVLVAKAPLPAGVAYGVVVLGAFAVSFFSFQLVVRRTPLVRWLGGAPRHQVASNRSART
ncbi:MAG: acyltransferase family protein [Myxococcaceae bacterium]|jgi:glucan biosynthesis protein C|nr:acyltransferase family protein [Myxococcaceae bacterium]MCA3015186.1 acyltransferase family protein [Myxococcaceae bacterium]